MSSPFKAITQVALDIESVPDEPGIRDLHPEWAHLSGEPLVEKYLAFENEGKKENDFGFKTMVPIVLQKILVLSLAVRSPERFEVISYAPPMDEVSILRRFFTGFDQSKPVLVSWNGKGFDAPVLNHRALLHGIPSSLYWEQGERINDFRYDNYQNRYHHRHTDLMDVLSGHQGQAKTKLDVMSKLCGLPGKLGMDGSQVFSAHLACRDDEIRRYCETDVVNTYLLFLRFELCRGRIDRAVYDAELSYVYRVLSEKNVAPWPEYLAAWEYRPPEIKVETQLTLNQAMASGSVEKGKT